MYRTHLLILALVAVGLVSSRPEPGDKEHTHIKIHVPYHIHEHTHTIVKKIYIPVKDEHDDYKHDDW